MLLSAHTLITGLVQAILEEVSLYCETRERVHPNVKAAKKELGRALCKLLCVPIMRVRSDDVQADLSVINVDKPGCRHLETLDGHTLVDRNLAAATRSLRCNVHFQRIFAFWSGLHRKSFGSSKSMTEY